MRFEQVLAAVREDDRDIPAAGHGNGADEALLAEMPQIARVRVSFSAVMVAQVARRHYAEGSHGRQRARLGLAQGVLAVPIVDATALV